MVLSSGVRAVAMGCTIIITLSKEGLVVNSKALLLVKRAFVTPFRKAPDRRTRGTGHTRTQQARKPEDRAC